jgi:hypothetical protein
MVARRIALVKPAAGAEEKVTHALQLFDSILWAFQGTTRTPWTIVAPDAAEVVVAHQGDPDERIAAWRAEGKLIVEFAIGESTTPIRSAALIYPFRAAQVLALLERLDAQLISTDEAQPREENPAAVEATQSHDPWSFVETLRTVHEVQNSEAWLVARDGKVPRLWLRADGAIYVAEQTTIQAIRRGTLSLARLELRKSPVPADGPAPRAGAELSWFAAYYASADLAPWLKPAVPYRLTRWPNFGSIGPSPAHLRVVASLASRPARPDEIAVRAHVSTEEAARVLNALAVANVVIAVDSDVVPVTTVNRLAVVPRGGFVLFLRKLRKHLGLGA